MFFQCQVIKNLNFCSEDQSCVSYVQSSETCSMCAFDIFLIPVDPVGYFKKNYSVGWRAGPFFWLFKILPLPLNPGIQTVKSQCLWKFRIWPDQISDLSLFWCKIPSQRWLWVGKIMTAFNWFCTRNIQWVSLPNKNLPWFWPHFTSDPWLSLFFNVGDYF